LNRVAFIYCDVATSKDGDGEKWPVAAAELYGGWASSQGCYSRCVEG